jgi:DNA-binding CsgD family transcriptional regulator
MANDRSKQLTDRQKQCLRLVREGFTTKEIAGRIHASPDAVDKSIKLAMAKLGVDRRAAAARMLDQHETATGYQHLDPQAADLYPNPECDKIASSPEAMVAPQMVREERAAFDAVLKASVSSRPSFPDDQTPERRLKQTIGKVLDWVSRVAGVILMILALAYLGSIVARHHEEAQHLRPK